MLKWKVILNRTGECLAGGFNTLAEADAWHDDWIDSQVWEGDDDYPSVTFEKYEVTSVQERLKMAPPRSKSVKTEERKVYTYTLCRKSPDNWSGNPGEVVREVRPSDDVGEKALFLLEAHIAITGIPPSRIDLLLPDDHYVVRTRVTKDGHFDWMVERQVQRVTGGVLLNPNPRWKPEVSPEEAAATAVVRVTPESKLPEPRPQRQPQGWDKLDTESKE